MNLRNVHIILLELSKFPSILILSIDPTIKILFVTALDILDELLSIVPGISKEQIMRKPVDKKIFTNTVRNMLG